MPRSFLGMTSKYKILIYLCLDQINSEARTHHGSFVPRNGATRTSGINRPPPPPPPRPSPTRQVMTRPLARCESQSCRSRTLHRGVTLNPLIGHGKFRALSNDWLSEWSDKKLDCTSSPGCTVRTLVDGSTRRAFGATRNCRLQWDGSGQCKQGGHSRLQPIYLFDICVPYLRVTVPVYQYENIQPNYSFLDYHRSILCHIVHSINEQALPGHLQTLSFPQLASKVQRQNPLSAPQIDTSVQKPT